ncbi:MAG: large conductance mechanosensitive channel protein MscL [Fibrobacter sp.]|nr:large conductance mechanosensitive channel protein MscL [Fibrobacter sp.]
MGIKSKAGSLLEEFKNFAFKGNIVDMAIGVIIGGAFGKIVSSFVADVVTPCITALISTASPEGTEGAQEALKALSFTWNGIAIPYGSFLAEVLNFLIVAFVIFLVMKKFLGFMQNMRKKEAEAPAEPPAPPEPSAEEKLLTEIRDLLKNK